MHGSLPYPVLYRCAAAFLICLCVISAPRLSGAETVTVFAAASTKTALDQIATEWQQETGHVVRISYGGSATLARQVLAGAPANLFLSASTDWMDAAEAGGALVGGSRFNLLGNRLVIVAHGHHAKIDPMDLPDLLQDRRLAMGLVNAVPAGQYGKQALQALGLWHKVAPQVAQTDNVRAALALVASGEAPYGVVYLTDARISETVSVVAVFDDALHAPIVYPLAVVNYPDTALAMMFASYLRSADVLSRFRDLGFSAPGAAK